MANKLFLFSFLIIMLMWGNQSSPVGAAQENGWDYLIWGMTVEEVQKAYTAKEGKAYEFVNSPLGDVQIGPDAVLDNKAIAAKFISLDAIKKYSYVKNNVGIFYQGKLVGKKIEVNIALLEKTINDLKKNFPNGKVYQVKDKFNPNLSLPVFEYSSEKIKIFTNSDGSRLYFYDARMLNDIIKVSR